MHREKTTSGKKEAKELEARVSKTCAGGGSTQPDHSCVGLKGGAGLAMKSFKAEQSLGLCGSREGVIKGPGSIKPYGDIPLEKECLSLYGTKQELMHVRSTQPSVLQERDAQ